MNFGFSPTRPPGVEPQRHRDTEKAQSHPPTRFLTQRRKDAKSPRVFTAWRGPGRQTTVGNRWAGHTFRTQAFVTVSRPSSLRSVSAGLATPSLHLMAGKGTYPSPTEEERGGTDAPPARWPVGRLAATSARAWSGRTLHRWSAIARSPTVPPSIFGIVAPHQRQPLCAFAPLRLCVLLGGPGSAAERLRRGKRGSLRLCVSVFLLCVSVSLWFLWFVGGRFLGIA